MKITKYIMYMHENEGMIKQMNPIKNLKRSWARWLKPIIPGILQAEIKRTSVQG
jgi:hypothetical protein